MFKRLLFLLVFAVSLSAESTKHITARILPNVTQTSAGSEFYLGIQFDIQKDWYTYWENPGDAGLAPNFNWTLPKGVAVGEAMFPTPKLKVAEGIRNYIYKDKVLFLFPVKVSPDYKGSFIRLKVDLDWLVCKESCIPEEDSLSLQVLVRDQQVVNEAIDKYFMSWKKKLPIKNDDLSLEAKWEGKQISIRGSLKGQTIDTVNIFPVNPELILDLDSNVQTGAEFSSSFTMDMPLEKAQFVLHLQKDDKHFYILKDLSIPKK